MPALNRKQINEILKLLRKFEELSNGTLSTWKISPLYLELKQMQIKYIQNHVQY